MTASERPTGGYPPQHQDHQPGIEAEMTPRPQFARTPAKPCGRLEGKVALITGGDSGIGRAVAVAFAKEGADVAIAYLEETEDAQETCQHIAAQGRRCVQIKGDIGEPAFCQQAVEQTVKELGHLDILVNNAGEQHPVSALEEITPEQLEQTFRTNIFGMFYLTQAALKHMQPGGRIINSASVTAYKGSADLLDYSATKGAIVAFTRSLSLALEERGILVNGVAPGPIWTPLIPASFDDEKLEKFGENTPMKRAGQPEEVAPCYVFLASDEASYMSGQMLHPNGGVIVNS